jgi:hypothetical protein
LEKSEIEKLKFVSGGKAGGRVEKNPIIKTWQDEGH